MVLGFDAGLCQVLDPLFRHIDPLRNRRGGRRGCCGRSGSRGSNLLAQRADLRHQLAVLLFQNV